MELEKVTSKQEVEIKKPLTREQAIARLVQLDASLRKVYCADPNFVRYGWGAFGLAPEQRFSLQNDAVYDTIVKNPPVRYLRKFSSMGSRKVYVQTQKILSRYALGGSILVAGGLTALFGFSPTVLAPLAVGAVLSGFASTRFYDGTKKNKIRWILSSIFLGEKSREAVAKYREKLERFNYLKESYDILVNLVLQEIESDNLLSIANNCPDSEGNYIAFLEHGEFAKVNWEGYVAFMNKSSDSKTKEEVLQLTHRMIEDKFDSLNLKK